MEMILTVANVAGGIVAGLMSFAIWELLRVLTGWKVDGQVAALRRRLADVEALRRAEQGKTANLTATPESVIVGYIEQLRDGEGATLTILCDNPDAESMEGRMAVECNASWTGWSDFRFYGESLLQCRAKAVSFRHTTPVDRPICDELEGDCS